MKDGNVVILPVKNRQCDPDMMSVSVERRTSLVGSEICEI